MVIADRVTVTFTSSFIAAALLMKIKVPSAQNKSSGTVAIYLTTESATTRVAASCRDPTVK